MRLLKVKSALITGAGLLVAGGFAVALDRGQDTSYSSFSALIEATPMYTPYECIGHPADCVYARALLHKSLIPRDQERYERFLVQAASQGSSAAQFALANEILSGRIQGTPVTAISNLKAAAKQGVPMAQLHLLRIQDYCRNASNGCDLHAAFHYSNGKEPQLSGS